MKNETIQELIHNVLETKEGLLSLILGIIKETPNNEELGSKIRENFKGYLEGEE